MATDQYSLSADELLPGHKKCYRCKKPKPYTAFDLSSRSKDGRRGECKTCRKEYRKANSAILVKKQGTYVATHLSEHQAWRRDHRARNLEKLRAKDAGRYAKDPNRVRQQQARRRARLKQLPNTLAKEDSLFAFNYWDNACAVCGCQDTSIATLRLDHWVPVGSPLCPGTISGNMLPLCNTKKGTPAYHAGCNQSKHTKEGKGWLNDRFGDEFAAMKIAEIETFFELARSFALNRTSNNV